MLQIQDTVFGVSRLAAGAWIRHGMWGVRSGHHDWRTVHLQPQGGGTDLPGVPRWHRVSSLLEDCSYRGDVHAVSPRWFISAYWGWVRIRFWTSAVGVPGDRSSVDLTEITLPCHCRFHGYQFYCSHTGQMSRSNANTGRSTGSADEKILHLLMI